MFTTPEQFTSTAKANIEAQLAILTTLTGKAFESVEKIIDLNINTAKASLEDSTNTARQLLAAKDPQEFFSLTAAQAQPATAKVIAYGRHLAGIASSTQQELSRATEEQIAATGRKVSELVERATQNAPAGSENVIAAFKNAMGNASAGYEQFTKTTKQAAEVIEANITNAVSQFTQAAEKTAANARARK